MVWKGNLEIEGMGWEKSIETGMVRAWWEVSLGDTGSRWAGMVSKSFMIGAWWW